MRKFPIFCPQNNNKINDFSTEFQPNAFFYREKKKSANKRQILREIFFFSVMHSPEHF
jgi:hypothetical protein